MGRNALGRLRTALLGPCVTAAALGAAAPAAARDLVASLGELPKVNESAESGPFAELIKAIDDVYTQGRITRRLFPFVRSVDNVSSGRADLHIPYLRDPSVDPDTLQFRFASERMGVVEFVLYSNVQRPITLDVVREKLRDPAGFSLRIEALRGTPAAMAELPMTENHDLELSLQMIAAGRIDALVAPQEEGDHALRKLRLKTILRSHYKGFDDTIIIPKGPAGDEVDAIVSQAIRQLKASGRWDALYRGVHLPYEEWQPAAQADW